MKRSELRYDDYSWKAVEGDDPTKTKEDATRFSRKEGYEVLTMINSFKDAKGAELTLKNQRVIEWMLHEHLPSSLQGRQKVTDWVIENFPTKSTEYPWQD